MRSVGLVVSTVNVNGIRAAARKGLTSWLAGTTADVVCLQETRAELAEVPADLHVATPRLAATEPTGEPEPT